MKLITNNPLDRIPESPRPVAAVWSAFLIPPLVSLLHLQVSYTFEHVACSTGNSIQIHILTILCVLVTVWAGLVAHRHWKRLGSEDPGQHPGPAGSHRLMALLGMVGAGAGVLFILAQWFPNFILSACIRT